MSLSYLLTVMQRTTTADLSAMVDERRKLGMVVSTFGISMMVAGGINLIKAIYIDQFTTFVLNSPALYYLLALITGIVFDILPIFLMYTLHT
jgi:hypothetical protein